MEDVSGKGEEGHEDVMVSCLWVFCRRQGREWKGGKHAGWGGGGEDLRLGY